LVLVRNEWRASSQAKPHDLAKQSPSAEISFHFDVAMKNNSGGDVIRKTITVGGGSWIATSLNMDH
jgi:hypothetical protein